MRIDSAVVVRHASGRARCSSGVPVPVNMQDWNQMGWRTG